MCPPAPKFSLLGVPAPRGDSSETPVGSRSPWRPRALRPPFQESARSCWPRDPEVLASGGVQRGGCACGAAPALCRRPGGCGSTHFPRGSLAPGCWQPLPQGPAGGRASPAQASSLGCSRTAGWGRLPELGLHRGGRGGPGCERVGLCARLRVRVPCVACAHRSWAGGGSALLFARLFPNMAPLLRTQGKKNPVVLSK